MKKWMSIATVLIAGSVWGQNPYKWTAEDSLKGEAMIKTIEQSLEMFYADYASEGNYDSIITALNYEADQVPEFSDAVYCERLEVMNEMSPFHLDCNDVTLSTIRFFVIKRRGFARVVLGRSKLYFDMFEEKLAKYNLPIELKYLAVIESGLRPQVKSRAGALGLWQFMYGTGRMFGLTENSYIDERMDPDMATEAACQYLAKLYGIYNDWNLALAAYNAGPGNVNKAIRRSGNKLTYWEVRPFLPKETQGYVPNFIAAAYLLTYHAEHNIVPMEANVRYHQLDTMCLKKGVHMESVASLLKLELEEIQTLNPIYKTTYIPKSTTPQCITLPLTLVGELVTLEDSLYALEFNRYVRGTSPVTPNTQVDPVVNNTQNPQENNTQNPTNTNFQYHKVSAGETMGTIASRYGMTIADLQQLNGLRSTTIYVGQRLKVSAGTGGTTVVNTPNNPTPPPVEKKYYSVRSGDTFSRIAQSHRMTISQLRRLNPGINIERLSVGQRIRVK
jgi:membrane-bound lytic murein transglycosylase D